MNPSSRPLHTVDDLDQRMLGAIQFVDSVTKRPISAAARLEARTGRLVGTGQDEDVPTPENAVRIRQNPSGFHVVFRAPFFDAYIEAFDKPTLPKRIETGSLRLRIAAHEVGPDHLPQEFDLNLPRSLTLTGSNTIFTPRVVTLFRAPGASVQNGWTILRVRVVKAGVSATDTPIPLPGVFIRVFKTPRNSGAPIGEGMTDWRGAARGEALIPLPGIQRFRASSVPGSTVVETEQAIEFEVRRDSAFTGKPGQVPYAAGIQSLDASAELQIVAPPPPVSVRTGREYSVQLAMP